MKKLIIAVLIMAGLSMPGYASMFAPEPEDYIYHFAVGMGVQALLDHFYPDYQQNWYIVCGMAATKELWDCSHGGYFDMVDLGMTALGGAFVENMEMPRK